MSQNLSIIPVKISDRNLQVAICACQQAKQWVVLLHGLQSNKKMYDDLVTQKFLGEHSILSLDFLGFGKSSYEDCLNYTLREQCEAVIQVLENLKIKNLILIGHSLGGMIGTLLLDRLKNRISSFINFEGNLKFEHCEASRLIVEKYSEEQFIQYGFDELLAKIGKETGSSVLHRLQWLRECSVKGLYRTAQSIVMTSKSGLRKTWNQSAQNKFYICGSRNKEKYEGLADFVIRDAGHFMFLDNPQECYLVLENIFRKL
jgi:hypothetical protein